MSISNIERLKQKFGFDKKDDDVDKYFQLIDFVYYQEKIFCEKFINEDLVSWSFEDGTVIILNTDEIINLLLLLKDLSANPDEQLLYGFNEENYKDPRDYSQIF